ncbi:MAG: hypothetical protein ACLQNE_28335 [Thermoguttaceae bacterium]
MKAAGDEPTAFSVFGCPMDERPTGRRRFQFSLRSLMIWTTLWSFWLSLAKIFDTPTTWTCFQSVWFLVLIGIRVYWGFRVGLPIAVIGSAVAWACWFAFMPGEFTGHVVPSMVRTWCVYGACAGGFCFGCLHVLVNGTNKMDHPNGR